MRGLVLIWIIYCHIVALLLFSHGFLLTRIVIDKVSVAQDIKPTFTRTVILIIDALRYDFTTPQPGSQAACHNNLVVMHELAARHPEQAVLLPFMADPPTTTLQRLKGLTTGSLPTFIDAGSNFAGTEILEDNLLLQLRNAGKRLAFVGDDTWSALYPTAFEEHLNMPFPSLNVWDLDTVDDGVYKHLFEYLNQTSGWDVAIAHCLGVDHVGHRYGPDHPEMIRKQRQMNDWITKLVATVDDDTLVVVMGDHGMNPLGDHGGDSPLELEAALWMYSRKGVFGKLERQQPWVAQIDLVPTLSLLWGVPIPFSNLGSPIQEAFQRAAITLADAQALTTRQTKQYVAAYSKRANVQIMDSAEDVLYQQQVLEHFRQQWAQYDMPSIWAGLFLLALGLVATGCARANASLPKLAAAAALGAGLGIVLARFSPLSLLHTSLFLSVFVGVLSQLRHASIFSISVFPCILLALHLAIFASNSFTIFEDRIVLLLINTASAYLLVASCRIADKTTRIQSCLKCIVFMGLSRAAASIRLCREEQGLQCVSTFYASGLAVPAKHSFWILLATTVLLTLVLRKALIETQSWSSASFWLIGILFPLQMCIGLGYWVSSELGVANSIKVAIGQVTISLTLAGLGLLYLLPVNIRLTTVKKDAGPVLAALGINSAMGSDMLQICVVALGLLAFVSKPLGAVALCILVWQLILLADVLGHCKISPSSMLAGVMLVQLGHLHFFATGHQMALPFIQWDVAFLASASPAWFSPLFVVANAFGSFILVALSSPLIALWKRRPVADAASLHVFNLSTTMMSISLSLTLATAVFATHFRRHLMVWKIFAPRYMCAAQILLLTDIFLCVGMLATHRITGRITRWQQTVFRNMGTTSG